MAQVTFKLDWQFHDEPKDDNQLFGYMLAFFEDAFDQAEHSTNDNKPHLHIIDAHIANEVPNTETVAFTVEGENVDDIINTVFDRYFPQDPLNNWRENDPEWHKDTFITEIKE